MTMSKVLKDPEARSLEDRARAVDHIFDDVRGAEQRWVDDGERAFIRRYVESLISQGALDIALRAPKNASAPISSPPGCSARATSQARSSAIAEQLGDGRDPRRRELATADSKMSCFELIRLLFPA